MKQFGILGYPLKHTLSPRLHAMLAEVIGEEMDYSILETPPDRFTQRLPELFSMQGFNVTIPYKCQIMEHLDKLDDSATRHGAVNVVAIGEDGLKTGYNTDCIGFVRAMESEGVPLQGKICIVGCGGAGRMFATECALRGARVDICVKANHLADATAVVSHIRKIKPEASVEIITMSGREEAFGQYDLLVNATPVGMFPNINETPLSAHQLENVWTVFDCVYNPSQTKLMREGIAAGCSVCGGMKMLCWQAAAAQEIWFGRQFTANQIQLVIETMEKWE